MEKSIKYKTAVEWLFDKMITEKHTISEWNDVVKQAKEMEKEHIINAAKIVLFNSTGQGDEAAEQYYNETYGGQDE